MMPKVKPEGKPPGLKARNGLTGRPAKNDIARQAQLELRRMEAFRLKSAGASYDQIGAALGVSDCQAYKDVQHAAARLDAEKAILAARHLDIELETLDLAQRHMTKVLQGGPSIKPSEQAAAANAIARISEQRAKLLGLHAPSRMELTGKEGKPLAVQATDGLTDEEILRRIEMVRTALSGAGAPALPDVVVTAVPTAEQDAAARYAEALAKRGGNGNGNGNGSHG